MANQRNGSGVPASKHDHVGAKAAKGSCEPVPSAPVELVTATRSDPMLRFNRTAGQEWASTLNDAVCDPEANSRARGLVGDLGTLCTKATVLAGALIVLALTVRVPMPPSSPNEVLPPTPPAAVEPALPPALPLAPLLPSAPVPAPLGSQPGA